MPEYHFFDIYGFILAVSGPAIKSFEKEYWRFRVQKPGHIDLYIEPTEKKGLPIRLRQDTKGIYIPFSKKENKAFYEHGVATDWLLYEIEPLISWKNKCFLHCGAVEKDGNAIIFPAAGGVGKTTLVTSLLRKGFSYLADDWLIIGEEGKAYPFFKTVHVFEYNLKKDKDLAKRVLGKKRQIVMFKIAVLDLISKLFPSRFVRIITERLMPLFSEDVLKVFPEAKVGEVSSIKKIFWLIKDKNIKLPSISKADYSEIAKKMSSINMVEMNHFFKNYYDYAYDHEENEEIENRHTKEKKIMGQAFKKADCYIFKLPDKIDLNQTWSLLKRFI